MTTRPITMVPYQALAKDTQQDAVSRFYDLFAGRLETYAIRVEGGERAKYVPSDHESVKRQVAKIGSDEFTEATVTAHLRGDFLIGVYPITAKSEVSFFALDFDSKEENDPDPWEAAKEQATVLVEEAGLMVYIERSQSGNGFHVWGFLDGPIDAGKLRHALHPFIEKTETYDRMFPNQDGVNEVRPLGNLIALPLHGGRLGQGNSAFVRTGAKGRPEAVCDQFEFLAEIELNPTSLIEELFEQAGTYMPEREMRQFSGEAEGLKNGWKVTHPKFGCEFMHWAWENPDQVTEPLWYAIACNLAQLSEGRDMFHEWSQRDELRYDPRVVDRKYDQALEKNAPHSCETIRGLGGNCNCDLRFPGEVYHPFALAKISFKRLVESIGVDDIEQVLTYATTGFEGAIAFAEQVEKDPSMGAGRKYGIESLDRATGMRDNDLILFAGRPGSGKTGFSCSIIDNLCMREEPNYFFSLEMSSPQVFKRLLSTRTGVSQTRVTTGQMTPDDWEKVRAWQKILANQITYPLIVDDMSRSTDRIFEVAAQLSAKHGKGVIWIDYLQLCQRQPKESMFDCVSRVTLDLKLMAKALQCPVVALVQLNRGADEATVDTTPLDSWLRGCLTADTKILRADTGAAQSIGSLAASGERNIPVWTADAHGKMVEGVMTDAFSTGIQQVYELRLASGRKVKATDNHPFLKLSGWTPLGELKIGDRVATPRAIPTPRDAGEAGNAPYLTLLAHWLGDGFFGRADTRAALAYCTGSDECLEDVTNALSALGDSHSLTWNDKSNCHQLRVHAGKLRDLVIADGLYEVRGGDKFIPEWVFGLSHEDTLHFLNRLWSTDGSLRVVGDGRSKKKVSIYYSTSSPQLAVDVQRLLTRVGILSRKVVTKKAGAKDNYNLQVTERSNQLRFLQQVGAFGPRAQQLEEALALREATPGNPNSDTIPVEVWNLVKYEAMAIGMTLVDLSNALGRVGGSFRTDRAIGRERLETFADVLDSGVLRSIATSDLFWDRVVSITPLGEQEVFDATVLGTHNFVADDILVHNSGELEQTADVIIFNVGEKGPGVKERTLFLHKERHREAGLKFVVEFNQPLMKFAEQGTWQVNQSVPDPKHRDVPRSGRGEEGEGVWYEDRPKRTRRPGDKVSVDEFLQGL